MTKAFALHERLAEDTVPAGGTDLCQVLLSKDARFPWIVLVPRQPGLRELHDLAPPDQILLMTEITHLTRALQTAFGAEKTNVAALGNMVPQLHIHIVMRYAGDAAWPGPIWGVGTPEDYSEAALAKTLEKVHACLP